MSNDRMKPLMLAALIGLLGTSATGLSVDDVLAQKAPKAASGRPRKMHRTSRLPSPLRKRNRPSKRRMQPMA